MRSRRLPRRSFLADSPRARGPVLALSPPAPSLPCARPCGCGGGTRYARPLRHQSREIRPGYRDAGRFRRRPSEICRRDELQQGHPAPPRPPRYSTTTLLRRRRRAAPSWGRRPISLPPAARHRSLPICQSTDAPPHRRRLAAGSFRPERGPCILEGGRVPGHGVREGQSLLSPFDFSLCP